MDLGLAGRVALVAGASQGLGLACARELAAEGASVVLCARDPDRLERACGTIRADGGTCLGVPADVSQDGAPAAVVARALAEYGRLDVLVPNSGGPAKKNDSVNRCWDLATANLDPKGKPVFNAPTVTAWVKVVPSTVTEMLLASLRQTIVCHFPSARSGPAWM